MRKRLATLVAVVLASASTFAHAHSNGTVFSSPVDGDGAALFWNPAAMALSPTSRLDIVANFDILQATYQRFGVDTGQTGNPFPKVSLLTSRPEPHLGIIIDKLWHNHLRLGFDVTVPNAAGAAWPETVRQNGQTILGPTRYSVTNALIFDVYAQIGASILVHRTLSIGVAVNIDLSRIDAHKDVDLANQPPIRDTLPCAQNPVGCENPTLSAPVHFTGTGASAGASVGVLWMPIPELRIGAAYISPVYLSVPLTINIDSAKISNFAQKLLPSFGTLPINGSGTAHKIVPQRVHAGIAGNVSKRIELMAMFVYINNRQANIIDGVVTTRSNSLVPSTLTIPGVKGDSYTVIGRITGRVGDRWLLGASVEYSPSSVPSAYMTPSNLDFNDLTFNLGAHALLGRRVTLGASFSQTIVFSRTITSSAYDNSAPVPYNLPNPSGRYTGNAERVGLDLSYAF